MAGKVFVVSLLISLCACGAPEHDPNGSFSSSSVSSQAALAAFQNGFYTFAKNQGCVKCHASIVHPNFAAPDVTFAYSEAKGNQIGSTVPLIDFSNPDSSIIITYAGNSHCNDTPCANPANSDVVKGLLESWAAAEMASSGGGGGGGSSPKANYMTTTVALPANIPSITAATPGVVRFQLAQLSPAFAALSKAVLEVEIQMVTPTEYRISRPKIAGNTSAVNVRGLHVYLNTAANYNATGGSGAEDANQGTFWNSVSATAAVFALPNPLPAKPLGATPLTTTTIQLQVLSTADVLTIGFDNLQ